MIILNHKSESYECNVSESYECNVTFYVGRAMFKKPEGKIGFWLVRGGLRAGL